MCALMLFLVGTETFRSYVHGRVKAAMMLVCAVLVGMLIYLGVKHKPIDTANLDRRIGLVPAFSGYDGLPETTEPPPDYVPPVDSVNQEKYLPEPVNQGQCGSCWAVAGAAAISARFNKLLDDTGEPMNPDAVESVCAPSGTNVAKWHASPQYILGLDSWRNLQGQCTNQSFGKCNGNTQVAAFSLSEQGVPNMSCVPYYAGDAPYCKTSCGSPEKDDYLECPGDTSTKQCLKETVWTHCKDGTEIAPVLETYDVRHVRGEAAMIHEIVEYGPILCGLAFYNKSNGAGPAWSLDRKDTLWGNYSDLVSKGYVVSPSMDADEYYDKFDRGGHALVLYGFGEHDGKKYWLARNSWGKSWGNEGNIRLERGVNAWGIESACGTAKVRKASGAS